MVVYAPIFISEQSLAINKSKSPVSDATNSRDNRQDDPDFQNNLPKENNRRRGNVKTNGKSKRYRYRLFNANEKTKNHREGINTASIPLPGQSRATGARVTPWVGTRGFPFAETFSVTRFPRGTDDFLRNRPRDPPVCFGRQRCLVNMCA